MPLKLRPTGLGSGIDKDRPDYTVYSGGWAAAGSTRPVAVGAPPLRNGAQAHLLRKLPHTLADIFECAHHLSPVVLVGERCGAKLQLLAHPVLVGHPPLLCFVDVPEGVALAGLAQVPRFALLLQRCPADERVTLGTPTGLSFGSHPKNHG